MGSRQSREWSAGPSEKLDPRPSGWWVCIPILVCVHTDLLLHVWEPENQSKVEIVEPNNPPGTTPSLQQPCLLRPYFLRSFKGGAPPCARHGSQGILVPGGGQAI